VSTKKEFDKVLDKAPLTHTYLAQRFVPSDSLVRVYVTGKEASLALQQKHQPSKNKLKRHINRFASSQRAKSIPVTKDMARTAVNAAQSLQRQVAGVDMVQDKNTHKWYILEVNSAPQLRSGSLINAKAAAIANFFDKELYK
jgi:glutathione synthase/RimK-type ligase-like ATP-grasp enzyme